MPSVPLSVPLRGFFFCLQLGFVKFGLVLIVSRDGHETQPTRKFPLKNLNILPADFEAFRFVS